MNESLLGIALVVRNMSVSEYCDKYVTLPRLYKGNQSVHRLAFQQGTADGNVRYPRLKSALGHKP